MENTQSLPALVSAVSGLQRQQAKTRQDFQALPRKERLIRLQEVEQRCGIKKSTIYALMAKGEFVQCVRLGGRSVAWPESQIDAWIAARVASASGATAGAPNA